MFHRARFVEDCKLAAGVGQRAVREVVLEAVGDPSGIIAELGSPMKAGVVPLYRADDLTVIHFVWAPCMTLLPHNHNMLAVIGVYDGREDNIFWRRIAGDQGEAIAPSIEAAGADSLGPGQVATMGRDIIHSVANPTTKMTGSIHVYGGDFFAPPEPRSQWDHETLVEQPWDVEYAKAVFRQAEVRYDAGVKAGA